MDYDQFSFLSTDQVAVRWSISRRTLEGWRDKGIGPTFHKIGNRVRYKIDDLERYEKAHCSIKTLPRS